MHICSKGGGASSNGKAGLENISMSSFHDIWILLTDKVIWKPICRIQVWKKKRLMMLYFHSGTSADFAQLNDIGIHWFLITWHRRIYVQSPYLANRFRKQISYFHRGETQATYRKRKNPSQFIVRGIEKKKSSTSGEERKTANNVRRTKKIEQVYYR